MKPNRLAVTALAIALTTSAGLATASPQDPPAQAAPANAQPAVAPAQGETETLMLVLAVDQHEIATAQQARAKNVNGPTLDYANMMLAEHSANLDQTRALLGPAAAGSSSPAVEAQVRKGTAERATLAAVAGDAYEKAYIDAMVAGHAEVLAMLDSRMPTASTSAVREHLLATREHVAKHLERARELQGASTR